MAVLIALVSLSCKDNFAQLKTISQFDALPIGEADTIRVVYTELAKTIAVLTAPKNIDYTNQPFPYSEFPNGVQVVLYDENNNETHVKADYGIMCSVLCVCLAFYMFIKIPLKDLPNILQAFDLSG